MTKQQLEDATEMTMESIKDIGNNCREIDSALDALQDMGLKLDHEEYLILNRQVCFIHETINKLKSHDLRAFFRELYMPLMIRLPKFNPEALAA